jgi:hypothetical protein
MEKMRVEREEIEWKGVILNALVSAFAARASRVETADTEASDTEASDTE